MTATGGRSRSLMFSRVSREAVQLRWPWPVMSRFKLSVAASTTVPYFRMRSTVLWEVLEVNASSKQQVAATVIALERTALDRWGNGDPSGFLEISAPDVVYFDPFIGRRIDGLEELTRYYEGLRCKIQVEGYKLVNPKVQTIGKAAVLTFNYASYGTNEGSRWNCTEVYRNDGDRWRIIHTHWSFTETQPGPSSVSF
jgi:ketosteroid isomerase-like protein